MKKAASVRTLIGLILLLAVLAGASLYLPQGSQGFGPAAQLPAARPVVALASFGIVLIAYGLLGLAGLFLARSLGLPEICDPGVTHRQRFLIPAIVGAAVGVFVIVGDAVFAPINGLGHYPHPPFPTSLVASITAGIGEEVLFRLFFISFWTWLISRVLLRGRAQPAVYWIVSVISAVAFGLGHLPSLMYLQGWTQLSQVPPIMMVELGLLNGVLGLAAAWLMRKYGFLAAVGVHFWADVVWHVLWGGLVA